MMGLGGYCHLFAYKGSQKFIYYRQRPIGDGISQDAQLQMVEGLLTIIFMMGQGGYWKLFWL
jgi:hypothetical protein